jgi:hypothetical protein
VVVSLRVLKLGLPPSRSCESTVARSEEKWARKAGMTAFLREARTLKSSCLTLAWVGSEGSR